MEQRLNLLENVFLERSEESFERITDIVERDEAELRNVEWK
jgi:hypothetical protein